MKLQVTWDNSSTFGRKEPKRVTIEGNAPDDMEDIIQEYIRPLLLSMGYTEHTVNDFLGEI